MRICKRGFAKQGLDKREKSDIVLNANELHLRLGLFLFAAGLSGGPVVMEEYVMLDVIMDSLADSVRLIPFRFLTYLAMEYLEHRAGEGMQKWLRRADKAGPLAGGLLGVVPQCGFSAAAANLYAGRVISLGTLMAVFLSTSDEMLPILVSEQAPVGGILGILAAKAAFGVAAGMIIDLILRRRGVGKPEDISAVCEKGHCHCEKGILRGALTHTLQIFLFILLVNFGLNLLLDLAGEDVLANLILNRPVVGPMLSGLVGMVPNCAGSVVITRLYLEGAMGTGAAMSGLLAGSGVGLLVLFRANRDMRENLKITGLLYAIGVMGGILTGIIWN